MKVYNQRSSPSPPLTNGGSEGAAPAEPRIEDYLDHVCAPLVGLMPYPHRKELRAELCGHLEALAATYEELGSERSAAVLLALRQFGPPQRLSRQWARECTRGRLPSGVQPAWRALPIAFGSFGLATGLGLMLSWIGAVRPGALPDAASALMLISVLYVLPALAGLATGLLAPARPALGAFFALALLMTPLALASGLQRDPLAPLAKGGLDLAFVQIFCWAPIGCAAVALGGSLQARLTPRPRQWVLPSGDRRPRAPGPLERLAQPDG